MTGDILAVWRDGAADGPTNMAADEVLAEEAARRGGPVIRIYSWAEPTVSLGGFQPIVEAEACRAIAGLPLVRRPSGGGAIVHGTDLTYAAAVPKDHAWGRTPRAFYDVLHSAMTGVLAGFGVAARLHEASPSDPPADAFLCFARRSPGDLVARRAGLPPSTGDAKVMGSAQRRLATVVLQHGSLLLAANTAVRGEAVLPGVAELAADVAAPPVDSIATAWIDAVAAALAASVAVQPDPLGCRHAAAIEKHAERYRDRRWTARR